MLVKEIPPKIKIYKFILSAISFYVLFATFTHVPIVLVRNTQKYLKSTYFIEKICSEIIKLKHNIIWMTTLRSQRES